MASLTFPIISNLAWDSTKDLSSFAKALREGDERKSYPMRAYLESENRVAKFNGQVFVKELYTREKSLLKVAFKAYEVDDLDGAYAEEFAYKFSQRLFHHIKRSYIPPTIVRTFNSGANELIGSCSYYIESDLDLWNKNDFDHAMANLDAADKANCASIIFFLSQWDNHPGNWLAPQDLQGQLRPVLIDNEGLVNYTEGHYKDRPWVAVAFSEKVDATIREEYTLSEHATEEEFTRKLQSYGFTLPDRRITTIYNNLTQRGEQNRTIKFGQQRVMIQYHQNNPCAFPNYTKTLPQETIEFYKSLDISTLTKLGENLIACNPSRFDPRKGSDFFQKMLKRRDEMCSHVTAMELSST